MTLNTGSALILLHSLNSDNMRMSAVLTTENKNIVLITKSIPCSLAPSCGHSIQFLKRVFIQAKNSKDEAMWPTTGNLSGNSYLVKL